MLDALEKHFPQEATWDKPGGGMAIWVKLPRALNTGEILVHASEKGVIFSPGDHFYANSPEKNMMRLCFTIAGPAAIEEGIKRLGAVIKERVVSLKKRHSRQPGEGMRALV
jgi:2-aminoadipate transaminase